MIRQWLGHPWPHPAGDGPDGPKTRSGRFHAAAQTLAAVLLAGIAVRGNGRGQRGGGRRQALGAGRPLRPLARRQHRGGGRAAERGAQGRRQRQDRQGRRSSRARPPATMPTRSTSSRHSPSTRGRTSTSRRMSGSASSPSPATPWTWRISSRPIPGPSPTSSRSCGTPTQVQGQDLRDPAGLRDPHVLLQQGHAAQDRQGRGLHRGPAGAWSSRASSPWTDLSELAKEVVDKGAAQIGIIHRPNAGPDYLMEFAAFGAKFMDEKTGKLLLPKAEIKQGARVVRLERRQRRDARRTTPPCRGTRSRARFKTEKAFIYHQGVWAVSEWQLGDAKGATWPNDKDGYFNEDRLVPRRRPASQGRHSPQTSRTRSSTWLIRSREHAELAAMLVAYATLPYYNTQHAVTTAHTAITQRPAQHARLRGRLVPAGRDADAGAHRPSCRTIPTSARYNGILFKALQGVETGRLIAGRRDRLPRGRDEQRARGQPQGRRQARAEQRSQAPDGGHAAAGRQHRP